MSVDTVEMDGDSDGGIDRESDHLVYRRSLSCMLFCICKFAFSIVSRSSADGSVGFGLDFKFASFASRTCGIEPAQITKMEAAQRKVCC